MNGHQGASRLARAIRNHIDQTTPKSFPALELGTVGGTSPNLTLTVDGWQGVYTAGNWFVCEYLTAPDPVEVLTGSDAQGGTVTNINLTRPKILHPLAAGDRVLVALLHNGLDPVVIGRVAAVGATTTY